MLEQIDNTCEKGTPAQTSHPIKINIKWIIYLSVKPKIKEKENIEGKLCHLRLGHDFLHYNTSGTVHKEKSDKLDFIKSFYNLKDAMKRIKG